jgi:hypothetical protein
LIGTSADPIDQLRPLERNFRRFQPVRPVSDPSVCASGADIRRPVPNFFFSTADFRRPVPDFLQLTFEGLSPIFCSFEEGLVQLRRIAKRLGLTSAGGISTLISRCRKEIKHDPDTRTLAAACRDRMRRRPPPFILPPEVPPITARHYHRAASRPRR